MTFLFLPGAQALALLMVAVLAVVIIYLLKPPPVPLHVASTKLWERVIDRRDDRKERWRYLLSLALALTIAALLALALAGLQPGSEEDRQRTLIVIDNSPSSSVRTASGQTRFERGIAIARTLVAGSGGPILVADTAGQLGGLQFGGRALAERRLDRISPQQTTRLSFPARSDLGTEDSNGTTAIHFITDGVSGLDAPEATQVHSIFEAATNVAISAFGARFGSLKRGELQAAIEVVNGSLTPATPKLEVRADGDLLIERPVPLAAGEAWSAAIDLSGHADKRIEAKITTAGDAQPLDDAAAFEAVARNRLFRIALVGEEGRPALELLLRSSDAFEAVAPEDADVLVVLGGDYPGPSDRPTLHVGAASYLGQAASPRDSRAPLNMERAHATLERTPWQSLRPRFFALPDSLDIEASSLRPILSSSGHPVLLEHASQPQMVLTAALDAALVSHTFFPEFFENAVAWLAQANSDASPGTTAEPRAEAALNRSERFPFVNRSPLAGLELDAEAAENLGERGADDATASRLWRILLVLAVVLLTLQGITAARRITV